MYLLEGGVIQPRAVWRTLEEHHDLSREWIDHKIQLGVVPQTPSIPLSMTPTTGGDHEYIRLYTASRQMYVTRLTIVQRQDLSPHSE